MISTIKRSTYLAIYRLLDQVSPISSDCGDLCGAACCTCGNIDDPVQDQNDTDFQLGIYLYPGEEKLFSGPQKRSFGYESGLFPSDWLLWSTESADDFDFPDSWHGKIHFVRCKEPPNCPREYRPLQCRFFPLAPHITKDGTFNLILSPLELPYVCPLVDKKIKLNPRFIKATYTVWTHLIRDPLILDLVAYDSLLRDEAKLELTYVPLP